MKLAIALLFMVASATTAAAQYTGQSYGSPYGNTNPGLYGSGSNPNSHYVNPYTRQDGTYVGGHQQTNPNSTQMDNYGTRGNYNPYTGQYGTHQPRY